MAGFPPLTGPGGEPQRPTPGGPGMPMQRPSPMMPQQAPPPPPPSGPGGGMGPASALSGMLSDLDARLGNGWQQLDLASRCLASALRSTDFQQTPAIVAVIQSQKNVLNQLLATQTTGTSGAASSGGAVPSLPNSSDQGNLASVDADAQPSADDEGGD